MYKLIGLFAFVAVVVGNDLSVGPIEGGKKILDQKFEASPAIWRQVTNVTVNATDGDVISHVVITDLRPGKDGEAKIVEGGEGHKNVTIELKSPAVFRGFEFNVEIYAVPENQHVVPTAQPKSQETPKDEHEQKVPITVVQDASEDSLRRTRKTDEDKDVTAKVSVSSHGTTVSVTPASHQSTPVSHQSTPVPSTTQVNKENAGVKINIPANFGKDVPQSNKPEEKTESDIIDPLAVKNQPTHMNDNEPTFKTTEKVATLPVSGLKDQSRNIRHTEDATTEAEVTISTTTSYESTTPLETSDSEDAPVIPYFNWNVKPVDTIKPIGNQGFNPPKTVGADNVAVSQPASRVPIPYTH